MNIIGASLSKPHIDRMTSPASYLCMRMSFRKCPRVLFNWTFEFTFVPRVLSLNTSKQVLKRRICRKARKLPAETVEKQLRFTKRRARDKA